MQREIDWLLREKYHGQKSEAFLTDCARLEAGEPLAYIIGSIPFLNCLIYLDSKPLIPRPETEYWIEKAITAMEGQNLTVLDLCAGSGAIGVAVARAIPAATVTFAEIDRTHLLTIEKNLVENISTYTSGIYPVVESDLFSNITDTFDFILTNPPYIDAEAKTVDTAVVTHEPHLALFGGTAGMEIIARIIAGARDHLNTNGRLWIEHEPFQCDTIATLAGQYGFVVQHHKDQYDTYRYSVLSPTMAK
jgi:release factor glutamine methyltransferase